MRNRIILSPDAIRSDGGLLNGSLHVGREDLHDLLQMTYYSLIYMTYSSIYDSQQFENESFYFIEDLINFKFN